MVKNLEGALSDSGQFQWEIAKDFPDLKAGFRLNYHLEQKDLQGDDEKRFSMSAFKQLNIVSKEDYLAWFRQEVKTRNDIVKATFIKEREVSKELNLMILEKSDKLNISQVRKLESSQGAEARKMEKVSGDLLWLISELQSNRLMKEAGGKNLQNYYEVLSIISKDRLPKVTSHLRNARLEANQANFYLKSAKD